MSNDCRYCLEALHEAALRIHKWLVGVDEPIPRRTADYLAAYARLCHRIDSDSGHTRAGRILEKMLENHETWGLAEADDLDVDEPIEYPNDVQELISMIKERIDDDSHT